MTLYDICYVILRCVMLRYDAMRHVAIRFETSHHIVLYPILACLCVMIVFVGCCVVVCLYHIVLCHIAPARQGAHSAASVKNDLEIPEIKHVYTNVYNSTYAHAYTHICVKEAYLFGRSRDGAVAIAAAKEIEQMGAEERKECVRSPVVQPPPSRSPKSLLPLPSSFPRTILATSALVVSAHLPC